jgi:plastocyanin
MRHVIFLVIVLLFMASGALACHCGAGGLCGCDGGCACTGGSADLASSMTTPTNQIVSLDAAAPSTVHVSVTDFSYSANVTINVGDTVQWNWAGGTHSVTSVSGSAERYDSGLQTFGTFDHTFLLPGTYWYYCTLHGFDIGNGTAAGMSATVTVVAAPEPGALGLAVGAGALCLVRRRRRAD